MSIVAKYIVRKLPENFVTTKIECGYEQDNSGNERKFVKKEVESRGGWLVIFPAGHSTRFETEEQLKHFELSTKAMLVDANTGLEVNQHGVPLALQHLINTDMNPRGDTEVLDGAEADPIADTLARMGVEKE